MKMRFLALCVVALAACTPAPTPRPGNAQSPLPDSIALERTPCFGSCPVYHLTLASSGAVVFVDADTTVTDTLPHAAYAQLYAGFQAIGFDSLPMSFNESRDFCAEYATDAPTVILTLYRGAVKKSVSDYHGCVARGGPSRTSLTNLRFLENRVDSVTRAERWKKPYHWLR